MWRGGKLCAGGGAAQAQEAERHIPSPPYNVGRDGSPAPTPGLFSGDRSPGDSGDMQPPDAKTIPDLLDELAARYPEHEALVGGETRLGYRALREEVRRLADARALQWATAWGDSVILQN